MTALYGLPQTRGTAELGKELIMTGLHRDGGFKGQRISITAVPTGPQTIRFDIYIADDSNNPLTLSIEQSLGVDIGEDFSLDAIGA